MGRYREICRKIKKKIVVEKKIPVEFPVIQGRLLVGKVAVIVGGTGGIGYAIAEQFVANGCYVIMTGTNEEKLAEARRKLGGTEFLDYILLDIKEISSIHRKFEEAIKIAESQGKQIDILVNCAGVHGPAQFFEINEEDYDAVMDINLKGAYFMCQEVGRYMKLHYIKGHILNISSASALKPAWTPYEISKWGIRGMTLGIARELIPFGIVVNCLAPGPTATNMLDYEPNKGIDWSGNPSGRMAMPEEIANWAVLMVSKLGDLVVGDSFYVSGGSGTICIDR